MPRYSNALVLKHLYSYALYSFALYSYVRYSFVLYSYALEPCDSMLLRF